jgi:hypothetical protein
MMTVKPSDFKHEICVYLEGVGECLVCFDILTPSEELDADHSDSYEIDFAVFDEQDKPITYDISKRHYNRCENKATDEMLDITTAWHKEWEGSV